MNIEQLKATILELFAELETKPEAKPVLELRQPHYCIENGEVVGRFWDNDEANIADLMVGNVFLTQADAEDELKYRKLCYKLLKYTRGVDWGDFRQDKYGLDYDFKDDAGIIGRDVQNYTCDCKIYFLTPEAREAAIKELTNDEWKFYFSYQSKAVVL